MISENHDILEIIFQTTNGYRLYEKKSSTMWTKNCVLYLQFPSSGSKRFMNPFSCIRCVFKRWITPIFWYLNLRECIPIKTWILNNTICKTHFNLCTSWISRTPTYILGPCKRPNNSSFSQWFMEFCEFPFATLSSHNIHRLPVGETKLIY